MTKEDCGAETVFVLNFEHLNFNIVSDLGFRYSDFFINVVAI